MALTFNGKDVNTINFNNNVGYIVAGNPTINDGVVSGFSADDYVRTVKIFPTSNISTLEWGCKFTTGSNVNYQGITGTGSYWGCYGFRLGDYGALVMTLSYSPNITISFPASTIKSNSTYISKAYWNATTKEFSAKVSGDNGKTWTTSSMVVSDDFSYRDVPVQFGRTQAGNFRGSIDLNETYIKVDGITWFSGKEQASKDVNYVIKDGKLVWANPNLYLRAPARSSADQGFGTPIINTGVTITDYTYGLDLRYRAYQGPMEGMLMLGNINSYWYQTDKISLFGTTNNFSKRTDFSVCRMVYDGPANTASLYWGDGTSETLDITSGTSFNIGPQKLGSGWNYNTGFDYYYYKLFKAGAVIHHFVPVPTGLKIGDYTVPSNGMWDIVTQQFFGNSGTGEFSYGKDN